LSEEEDEVFRDGDERRLSPPSRYFAASAFFAARAFAASDIFFRVAAEITLFFAGGAAFADTDFTGTDFFAAVEFFDGTGLLAGVLAERTYGRF
jgi:hypothetical protein